jgi:type II restriction enzyme
VEFGFRETQAAYNSGSQSARVWTEEWAAEWLYCPNCGHRNLSRFTANLPVADFYCNNCYDQYELKSKKGPFGPQIANGAYSKKIERLSSDTNPNFILLNYNFAAKEVISVCMIPKHFFTHDIVHARPALKPPARRAGWIGSNIQISQIPESGRIYLVRDKAIVARESVIEAWKRTLFLRDQDVVARGWLVEVMKCVESIGKSNFGIDEVYQFAHLGCQVPKQRKREAKNQATASIAEG